MSPFASVYSFGLVTAYATRQTPGDQEPEAWIRGWMTLTKILFPICLYCLKCTKFGQMLLKLLPQMSDFKANMHQIRFQQGLSSRPRWVAYCSSPQDPLAGSKGAYS